MNKLGEMAAEWYEENVPDSSAYLIGHSVGMHVEDLHLFRFYDGMDMEFEENMVFEIEAWDEYDDINIGLGVEDLYIVTKTGCEKLSSLATDEVHEIK
jgi:Xaa-Pro aminopeptidase